jgi:2-polyprenyl-3-methyl-5-hydroxy-6-metoxy-1,4-benzoquinol methylase
MKEIFDKYIETSFDGQRQAEFKFRQFDLNYRKFFPVDTTAATLDIGIGRGEMLSCMRRWGYRYEGIDISPSTVNFCRSLDLNCDVTADTTAWLRAHPDSFDLITCLDVLEHIQKEHTIAFLGSLRGSLKRNGRAIIQVPNLQSPFGYLHHFNDFTHVSGFVEHSLAQVLIAAGFTRFEFHGFEEIHEITLKSMLKRMLRLPLRKAVRFMRAVNSNPNPVILDPVFFAIAVK